MGRKPLWKKRLTEYIHKTGGRVTPARMNIAEVFFSMDGHPGIETLSAEVKRRHPGTGEATIYRTMRLLCQADLAEERQFGEGFSRFERVPSTGGSDHHDHLICMQCGAIVEFEDPEIELLQNRTAERHGFSIKTHKLEIYGICPECLKANNP